MKFSRYVGNGPVNKWLNFGGDPNHRLDTGIVFRIRHYCQIRKVVSTDCAAQLNALAGIAIATITSLRRRRLAEVCTVPVLLVYHGLVLFCVQRRAFEDTAIQLVQNKSLQCFDTVGWTSGRASGL